MGTPLSMSARRLIARAHPRPLPRSGRGELTRTMVSHSGLITVMDRAARKAAPRLRRDFNEVQQLQVSRKGPADFVTMADQRAEQTIFEELSQGTPRLGLPDGGARRDRRRSQQAALHRRSARRHDQLPPRHPAFRDLDRGRGAAGERQAGDHHRRWSISRSPTRASGPKRAGAPGCRSSGCASRRGATWRMR